MSSRIAQGVPGSRALLMGNEAIARGAVEAGVRVMTAYPGTPSSEIAEVLAEAATDTGMYVEWSTNEKVAFEVAAGAALVGTPSMVAMKNAGLNVAMDTFMTLPYTGVPAPLVVVVADDPGAHYSSNEQDTRLAAAWAEIPCFEPANQQEAKDMVVAAVRLSALLELPVFVRSVSRLSHASGDVRFGPVAPAEGRATDFEAGRKAGSLAHGLGFNKHYKTPFRWNVYGPPGAVAKHRWLHGVLTQARAWVEETEWNRLDLTQGADLGVIMSGLGNAYGTEALRSLGVKHHRLRLGLAFPVPEKKIAELLRASARVLVIEEGDPLIEDQTRAVASGLGQRPPMIYGKRHVGQAVPAIDPWGELNPDVVEAAVRRVGGLPEAAPTRSAEAVKRATELVASRSSTLCAGCSHLGSYWAIKQALRPLAGNHIVNGDIGCYEQAGYGVSSKRIEPSDEPDKKYRIESPYEVLDTLYVMGGGLGLAEGQVQAGYTKGKVLAVAGDSTFFHATLPAVANAAYNRIPVTFVVLSNRWTAMTGHQPNPTTGRSAAGEAPVLDIAAACRALGIERVIETSAYDLEAATAAVGDAIAFGGPAVVILNGECRLQLSRRHRGHVTTTVVDEEACTGCKICLQLGCPAVTFEAGRKKAGIDKSACTDCGLCVQVCPSQAIRGEVLS